MDGRMLLVTQNRILIFFLNEAFSQKDIQNNEMFPEWSYAALHCIQSQAGVMHALP